MRETPPWQAAPFRTCARWRSECGSGLEHLEIKAGTDGIVVESVVVGDRFDAPCGAHYKIMCAPDWSVRHVRIDVVGGDSLQLISDGMGNWTDGNGAPLTQLAGCIDIDISATPFTNTLPIRRLGLAQGQRRVIRVVYITVPALEATLAEQAYTCVEPKKTYRYEGLFRAFEADLAVDGHGLVCDYPSLFRRIVQP